jgi:pimeloyl-ACP methyl ester carboxylesterase
MYPRLDPDLAANAATTLRPGAPPEGDYPLEHHPDVPRALVYAAKDEFFEPDWERWAARELLGVEPVDIPGGHFPMLEDPGSLGVLLDGLVSEFEQPAS